MSVNSTSLRILSPEMVEGVAKRYHDRNCSVFNGKGITPSPPFVTKHRDHHLFWLTLVLRDIAEELGMSFQEAKEHGNSALEALGYGKTVREA